MQACGPDQVADVGPWRWLAALALVSAAHVLVAERLADLGSASAPPAAPMVIEASLLEPDARLPPAGASAEPVDLQQPEPLVQDPSAAAVPEPVSLPPPEPEPVPEPPPAPEPARVPPADPPPIVVPPAPAPPKVAPKRAAKAGARSPAVAARHGRDGASLDADGAGGAPVAAPATAPRHDAAYLSNPAPKYPATARRQNLQGKVLVYAVVAPAGHCARAEVRRSSGHAVLDEAALQAVRAWRFVPATRDGRPVAAGVEIPIVFRLEG